MPKSAYYNLLKYLSISLLFSMGLFLYTYYGLYSEFPRHKTPYFFAATIGILTSVGAWFPTVFVRHTYIWAWSLLYGSIFGAVAIWLLFPIFMPNYTPAYFIESFSEPMLKATIISALVFIIARVMGFVGNVYFSNLKLRISEEEFLVAQINLRFEVLTRKLNPHFLFNNLNTISALLYQSPQTTERYIREFAHVWENTTQNAMQPLVPFSDELKTAESYLNLMQTRFPNAIVYTKKGLLENVGQLPPMSVQILFENALQHNKFTEKTPLTIELTINKNSVMVQNAIKPKETDQHKDSHQIGLENIKKRYQLVCKQQVLVSKYPYFKVTLPLLSLNNA